MVGALMAICHVNHRGTGCRYECVRGWGWLTRRSSVLMKLVKKDSLMLLFPFLWHNLHKLSLMRICAETSSYCFRDLYIRKFNSYQITDIRMLLPVACSLVMIYVLLVLTYILTSCVLNVSSDIPQFKLRNEWRNETI